MIIDDILDIYPNYNFNEYYLRDAIIFSIPFDFLFSNKNINGIVNPSNNEFDGEKFTFPYSRPPFNNILIKTRNNFCLWILFDHSCNDYLKYGILPVAHMNYVKDAIINDAFWFIAYKQNKYDYSVKLKDIMFAYTNKVDYDDFTFNIENFMSLSVYIVLKVFSLLNCKNIRYIENKPSKAVQSKRKKKNKLPLLSCYTLEVKSINKKSKSNRSNSQSLESWSNRIHICRGHFKQYTKEKPLLGKHEGIWWWEPHICGKNNQGMIVKDYSIKPKLPNT